MQRTNLGGQPSGIATNRCNHGSLATENRRKCAQRIYFHRIDEESKLPTPSFQRERLPKARIKGSTERKDYLTTHEDIARGTETFFELTS